VCAAIPRLRDQANDTAHRSSATAVRASSHRLALNTQASAMIYTRSSTSENGRSRAAGEKFPRLTEVEPDLTIAARADRAPGCGARRARRGGRCPESRTSRVCLARPVLATERAQSGGRGGRRGHRSGPDRSPLVLLVACSKSRPGRASIRTGRSAPGMPRVLVGELTRSRGRLPRSPPVSIRSRRAPRDRPGCRVRYAPGEAPPRWTPPEPDCSARLRR
jgi:hypothetical protein